MQNGQLKNREVYEMNSHPMQKDDSQRSSRKRGFVGSDRAGISPSTIRARAEERCSIMDRITSLDNLRAALKRVRRIIEIREPDGVTCEQLDLYIEKHWMRISGELKRGQYKSVPRLSAKDRVGKGSMRDEGILEFVDRTIQQAMLQVLQPIFDPHFSSSSFGFRLATHSGNPAGKPPVHAAVMSMRGLAKGQSWIVRITFGNFFVNANHDILMARLQKRVSEEAVLKTIGSFLHAIAKDDTGANKQEVHAYGPLYPLLLNILLDDLDTELEMRKHRFCRHEADLIVFARSRSDAERVKEEVEEYLEKTLLIKVNRDKCRCRKTTEIEFLGYGLTDDRLPRLKVADECTHRLEEKIETLWKQILRSEKDRRKNLGVFSDQIRGWMEYFKLASGVGIFKGLSKSARDRLRDNLRYVKEATKSGRRKTTYGSRKSGTGRRDTRKAASKRTPIRKGDLLSQKEIMVLERMLEPPRELPSYDAEAISMIRLCR